MKMVVFPPLTPPLKSSSLLLIGIGACSANSTSTPVVPLPMIAGLQAFSAEAVVVASSLPCLQVGTPFALTPLFLSASRMNSLSAGGCLPSVVWIFPETLRLIGVSFALRQRRRREAAVEGQFQVAHLDHRRLRGDGDAADHEGDNRAQGECQN